MTDSFTQTPNFVFDLMSELTPAEFKVVMIIVRATYGHHQEQARISMSLFVDTTGLTRQGVFNCIESLLAKNIIERTETKNSFEYRLLPGNSVERNRSTQLTKSFNSVEQNDEQEDENRSTELNENETPKTEIVQLSRTKSFNSVDPLNKKEITTPSNDGNAERSTRQAKLDLTTPEDDERATKTRRSELKAAYVEVLGHKNINHAQAGMGIKQLEHAGCTPEQLKGCYQWLKLDPFWEFKPISTQTIFKNLQEYLRYEQKANGSRGSPSLNGHSKLPTKVNFSVGEVLK
jgi:phage replication O-like protein O